MTGFAQREGAGGGWSWAWEIRAVNARGLDLRLRLPEGAEALDPALRRAVQAVAARGAVTVGLRAAPDRASGVRRPSEAAVAAALDIVAALEAQALARDLELAPTSAAELMSLRGLAEAGEEAPLPLEALEADLAPLLAAFDAMRRAEGVELGHVLSRLVEEVAGLAAAACDALPDRAARQDAALREALARTTLAESGVDPARLAQELALIAVKADVAEELDRLEAHVAAARGLLAGPGPHGRKLDFLTQEFNREANTLCAKAGSAALTRIGLDLKLAIDRMREQGANLE